MNDERLQEILDGLAGGVALSLAAAGDLGGTFTPDDLPRPQALPRMLEAGLARPAGPGVYALTPGGRRRYLDVLALKAALQRQEVLHG